MKKPDRSSEALDHLIGVARCPIVVDCLTGRTPDHPCAELVLSQWPKEVPAAARAEAWPRWHQLPEPWAGHLRIAALLFVASNPGLGGKPIPIDALDGRIRPLLRESRRRHKGGEPPLFNSHMFDGSQLPLEENLRIAAELLREADEVDVLLELEIGAVGGEEDGIDNSGVDHERLYTTPSDALAVARTLGLGERGRYLLAATFGNVHGHYAPGNVKLRPELLGDLQQVVADRFDFVFHGGSGSSDDEIARAVQNGVVKMNLDTDMQYAFTRAVEVHLGVRTDETDSGVDKRIYDPRAWGRKAEQAMAARVAEACTTLGSRGRTIA